MLRFYWFALRAYIRGLRYEWPRQAPITGDYSGVSCGLKTLRECREMYGQGWEPWCFQWAGKGYRWSRLFRVPLTPEEIQINRDWEADLINEANERTNP